MKEGKGREAVLSPECLPTSPGGTEDGVFLTTGYGSLRGFRTRGAAPRRDTCSRGGRGSSGAGARTGSAHCPLLSAPSGAAKMDCVSRRGGRSGPSSGSASATGHLAPGSFHPCRGRGGKMSERKVSAAGEKGQWGKPV